MIKTEVSFDIDARESIGKGVDIVADATKSTLGGKGRNAIIDQGEGRIPLITKDGVTCASSINLPDSIQRMGQQLVQNAAIKTVGDAGDGTTTTTVLTQAILNAGMDAIASGDNSVDIKKGIDLAVKEVVSKIKDMSIDISDKYEYLLNISTVAANGDKEIGKLVADVMDRIRLDGLVFANQTDLPKTHVDIIEGAKVNNGYESPAFINVSERMEAAMQNASIVLCDQHMNTVNDIIPVIEAHSKIESKPPIVWFVSEIDGEALSTIIRNNNDFIKSGGEKGLSSLVVKMPGDNQMKTDALNDLAALTNATVISHNQGVSVNDIDKSMLGFAGRVVADSEKTMILDCSSELLEDRVDLIKAQIKTSNDDNMKRKYLEGRLARLTGGVAIISVGGITPIETKEKFDLIEDAIGSTKAALQEGVVCGGGIAFLNIIIEESSENEAIQEGIEIVKNAILTPFSQIMINAGENPGVIHEKIAAQDSETYGYDVRAEEYVDMVEHGIIDPAKVSRVSLENAASVAGLFLTTEVIISNIKE